MATLLQDLRYANFRMLGKKSRFHRHRHSDAGLGLVPIRHFHGGQCGFCYGRWDFAILAIVLVAEKVSTRPYPLLPKHVDWRDQSHSFESMEATRGATITLTGSGEPETPEFTHGYSAALFRSLE